MKLLLVAINAKYIHSNLAVYSLQAYAGEYRKHIQLAEFTINNTREHILQEIYKAEPDVLCFSCYIWNIETVRSVAEEFHKLLPDVPIWAGGPEASFETETFLRENAWCKGIMVGEGEATFKDLCEYYVNREKVLTSKKEEVLQISYANPKMPSQEECFRFDGGIEAMYRSDILLSFIDGLSYRFINTAPRKPLCLDDIPFPYWDSLEDFSNRIIYYESSRGCPFSCSYCLSSVDKRLRFRSLELVLPELQFFLDRKVPQVKFVDRTFNCSHEHAMKIWEYIAKHDNGITNFHFEISADLLRDEEIYLLSKLRPGLVQLEIGVQSTNEATISEIHRTMELSKLKTAVKRIQDAGNIHEHLDLIAGLPFEDLDRFKVSFDEIYSLKSDQLQLGFLKVLKGSYMYEHAKEYKVVYTSHPPYEVLQTRWLSFTDIIEIKKVEEMLEVYYNSGQFKMTVMVLELKYDSAYEMFRELGGYYERKGLFEMNHSRLKRAEILLDFSEDVLHGSLREMIKEALIYDLYSRENCKTRPSWAPDPASFKEMTHKYCLKGKLAHIEPFHYEFPDKSVRTMAMPEYHKEPLWYLFNYDYRDPLDNQAGVEKVTML